MEFELNSMKKSSMQNKAELKHLGTVVINDLKNLKVCNPDLSTSDHIDKVIGSWVPLRRSQVYIYPWSSVSRCLSALLFCENYWEVTNPLYELCFRGRMRSLGNSSVNCVKSFRISTGGFFLRNDKFQKYTRCREQKADVANLRKDFISLKEYNRVQVRTRLYECNCTIVLHDDDASIRWGALNMFWRQCWWKYQRWEEKFQEFNSGGKII